MKVGIVAGEKSGDYLGSELIKTIKARYPQAEFVGLCGPQMKQQGATSLAEMDKISIMGFEGLLSSVREIVQIRKTIRKHMLAWRPDVFIGIDVPDFNLALERKLKESGIPTVHYVSPTVWAWRSKRIKKIRKSINLMLTLFPFEEIFYIKNDTPVKFVGHPMANKVANWQIDEALRKECKADGQKLVAILPGSRMGEVSKLAPIMLESTKVLARQYPNLSFVIPAASDKIRAYLIDTLHAGEYPVSIVSGRSQDVLALCDLTLLASGTAALEAALFAKPMVVMYKVGKLNEFIGKHTLVVEHVSMPNHLIDPPIVTELLQQNATVEKAVTEISRLLDDSDYYQSMQNALAAIAPQLDLPSSDLAFDAIEALLFARATAEPRP